MKQGYLWLFEAFEKGPCLCAVGLTDPVILRAL